MTYYNVTGMDNLIFFSKIYGVKNYKEKIVQLAKDFGIYEWLNEYTEHYSWGMRLKLNLIRVLLIDRPILYLDEPTAGLDPNATKEIIGKILDLKKGKKTIILTTHRMHVANATCDRIALLKEGNIIKVDTTKNLKKSIMDRLLIEIEVKEKKDQLIKELQSTNFVEKITPNEYGLMAQFKSSSNYPEIFEIVKNYKITKFREIEPSLEEVFTTYL